PYEAGLDFAVRFDKDDFIGRGALEAHDPDTVRHRLTCLTVADPDGTVMGGEPVYAPGSASAAGYVTSAGYGYTIGTGIAYAWLPADLGDPGTALEIGYFGRRVPATAATDPLYDPEMKRVRT
ncbi:aminomethyl transferase family protein, partial [Klebsiella pneumoniae]